MSSPIALPEKKSARKFLVKIHQRLSHKHRVDILARRLAAVIGGTFPGLEKIRCLDVGCGDMAIAETIRGLDSRTIWSCIDLYELPDELKGTEKWSSYRTYDGRHFPHDDKSMDVIMICDVLHHAGDAAAEILREAARVAGTIIVKDHFEYSLCSRFALKAMDFVGNWGYGVAVPKRYFTHQGFKELCAASGLKIGRIEAGIDLYGHLPGIRYLLRPSWQFIAVLKS